MDGPWKVYFEQGAAYDDALKFIQELGPLSSKSVWYFHPNGNEGKGPHFHGLIYDYKKTAETLRNTIKKKLNLEGGAFAVSDKLPKKMGGKKMTDLLTPTYITYMSKGQFDPVFVNGDYELSYLELLKTEWKDKKVNGTQLIFVEDKKKTEITQWALAQMSLARYQEYHGVDDINVFALIKIVIMILKENKKLAHKRAVANIVQDVLATINVEEYSRQILSMV